MAGMLIFFFAIIKNTNSNNSSLSSCSCPPFRFLLLLQQRYSLANPPAPLLALRRSRSPATRPFPPSCLGYSHPGHLDLAWLNGRGQFFEYGHDKE